MTGIYKV